MALTVSYRPYHKGLSLVVPFAYSSSVLPAKALAAAEALAKEDCAAVAAPVLDGSEIRIEFDSEERGFDCMAIKNKLGGGEFWTQGYRELMKPRPAGEP